MADILSTKKAHFIGIAGKGMSAVALLLRQEGWEISGSDEGFYPPVSEYLAQAGIPFIDGYRASNIPENADLIIIGKNAKLVPESNEEVTAAFESGKKVVSFADVLRDLTEGKETIVVAGSYGKSTCTALLAWCLAHAGKDPSYFIGEITRGLDAHAHLGGSDVFVLEGDEYPSSNWDSSSKFLHYNTKNLLLTSATHDHVNVYPTHEDYLAPFKQLIETLPEDGIVVVGPEPYARDLAAAAECRVVRYSLDGTTEWHAENIKYGERTTFDLIHRDNLIVAIDTGLLGAHNIENIVGVGAMLLEKGLVTPHEFAAAVRDFQGVKRRMESLAPASSVPVFEGFGSSYEKARSAIQAMQTHFPGRRLVVVFEPHTFTWRNRAAIHHYDDVFAGADRVYIYEPASQGAGSHAQLSQEEIVAHVRATGSIAEPIHSAADLLSRSQSEFDKNDAVLLLTSGDLGGLIQSLPDRLTALFPNSSLPTA